MATGDLTSSQNALQWIGLTTDDGTVARLITALSTQIQKFLGYQVLSASYSRTFNGYGGFALVLPDRPLTAVTSVSIDGIAVPAAPDASSPGFVFDDTTIYLRGYRFCRGVQNVAAAYTAGLLAVPGDIEQACLDWIKLVHDNLDTLPGLTKLRAGDSEIDYGEAFAKLGSMTFPMPASIASDLILYRRVTPS